MNPNSDGTAVLVVGPARSGKSTWAEQRLVCADAVDYVATSQHNPDDPEWTERIRLHRERRPAHWATLETIDLADVVGIDNPAPVLIDCLAVWMSRIMDREGVWENRPGAEEGVALAIEELVGAVALSNRDIIMVSNEVGAGLVPPDPHSRYYRDQLGILNARVAAVCDEVWLCHVGIARRWDQ